MDGISALAQDVRPLMKTIQTSAHLQKELVVNFMAVTTYQRGLFKMKMSLSRRMKVS